MKKYTIAGVGKKGKVITLITDLDEQELEVFKIEAVEAEERYKAYCLNHFDNATIRNYSEESEFRGMIYSKLNQLCTVLYTDFLILEQLEFKTK